MINLVKFIEDQKCLEKFNTKMYNLVDFYEKIKQLKNESLETKDFVLIPFYIQNEKRLELYYCELNIRVVRKIDRKKLLSDKTGKSDINEIPKDIIERYKICCIEILDNEISKENILQYIRLYIFK